MAERPHPHLSSTIVCVGGGISGIALGAILKRQYSFTDVHFYEREKALGGTWFVNTYPGAACDVPSALYSFSFAQNPGWTSLRPRSEEIKAYLDRVADDYDIPSRTSFRTEVVRAEWDDASARWTVHLKNLDNGAEYTHECKILFSASGVLVNPKTPVIPGQDRFRGPQIHSARWDHSVSLAGKNVAIIGNGCTGTQILSAIAPEAASITQFARSKHWIKAENNTVVTPTAKWALQNIPLMQSLLRFAIYCTAEWDYRLQTVGWFGDHERAKKMKDVGSLMRKTAPKKFHDLLIPEFTIMCKRVVQGLEYLEALNLPNVTLTDEAIIEITETGILAGSTNYPVDVIVYATGFYTDNVVSPSELLGRDGKKLQQLWIERGGPGAYNTTAVNGFPNFFIILGPNSLTGHTSCILAIENTIGFALKVLKPVLTGNAYAVEIKKKAELDYIDRVQEALKPTVFNTGGCATWYTAGVKNGYNSMIYPWGQVYFQYRCTFVKKSDWTTRYTRRQPKSAVKKLAVLSALIALLGAGIKYTALGGTLAVLVKQRVPGDYLNRLVQLRTALGM